jgi:hypothetical protein
MNVLILDCLIKIGDKRFDSVHEVEVVTSGKVLEDTATLKIPSICRLERNGRFISNDVTASVFAVGDEVSISLGYNGTLKEEFRGYLKRITSDSNITELVCEDSTYALKRGKRLNKSWESVSLEQMLGYVLAETGVKIQSKVPVINFSHFYLRDVTPAQVLQELIDKYGLTVYFSGFKQLYVGLGYDLSGVNKVKYDIGRNVISDNLELMDADDTQLRVKAVGWKPNGEKIEAEIGDGADPDKGMPKLKKTKNTPKPPQKTVFTADKSDGVEVRTLHFYNVHDREQLKEMARSELRKRKFTGYKGGLTTFLIPDAKVGDTAILVDSIYQRGDGEYIVDKVTTSFGVSGGRRKVDLGLKIK